MYDALNPRTHAVVHDSDEGGRSLEDKLDPGLDPWQRPRGGLHPSLVGALLDRPKG